MKLNVEGYKAEFIAETDEEVELIDAMIACIAVGGFIRATPIGDEAVLLEFDGDSSRN